ncbi:hypothetical protein J1G43_17075 [Cellulomonas sp. zg-ZUI22]|uniref:hypothetical protein n=1 Tax=Cellulomonas sp. zg-ZUI22 TaxID=2816955 RepID=UPI001A93C5BF|nr:hypothetical protein [Cellulomonas sp. zg-ZUI22]MBO0901676.1 hypothetical protein [Cellulomonas sp. zg-ZUI22]
MTSGPPRTGRRRVVVAGALGAGVLAAVVSGLLNAAADGAGAAPARASGPTAVAPTTAGGDAPDGARAPADAAASPGGETADPVAPPDAAAAGAPPVAPLELPAVGPREAARTAGAAVRLAAVERVDGVATSPGEIAGPAVRCTVEVTNEGDTPVDLALVAVNASTAGVPLVALVEPGGRPLAGSLAPGASGTGVFLFRLADGAAADVTLVVDVLPGEPAAVFAGVLG